MKIKALGCILPALILVLFSSMVVSAADDIQIAAVNMNKVIDESRAGQKANEELLDLIEDRQAEVNQLAEEIDTLRAELAEQPDDDKQQQLNQLLNEYQQQLSRANQEIQAQAQTMRNRLVGEIQAVIREISEERKYSLVIDSTTITYFTRVSIIDITGEVVRRYDEITQTEAD